MLRTKSSQFSFYGNHIYDRVIPEDHSRKLLNKAADFSFVNDLCRDAYTPAFGRPACEPEMMFKIIFLQVLYNVSDRRIEEEVNFNLVLKWFVGLTIDESPPDSSSLTRFHGRLGEERFANIFNQIVEIASELKRFHGLKEARYWGRTKMAIQFTMTAIACNLKRIVKLLFYRGCGNRSFYGKARQRITVPISG